MKRMNLLLLLVISFMFVSQTCFSQRSLFVAGGVQTSWIGGDSPSWTSGLIGGQVGVGAHIANLNDQIGFRGELNLSMMGSNYDDSEYGKGHANLMYLNLPLVLRYLLESGFYGELGIQPGLLLSAKDHYEGQSEDFKDYAEQL